MSIDDNEYKKLRIQFSDSCFRVNMKNICGNTCSNCGSDEYIEYHHIVPLKNGGTNLLTNIVPLCEKCHRNAHNRIFSDHSKAGRPKKIEYEDAEPIIKLYFDEQIGKRECMELLGLAPKNKTTWYRLTKEYRKIHNVSEEFKNNIDINAFHKRRVEKNKILHN